MANAVMGKSASSRMEIERWSGKNPKMKSTSQRIASLFMKNAIVYMARGAYSDMKIDKSMNCVTIAICTGYSTLRRPITPHTQMPQQCGKMIYLYRFLTKQTSIIQVKDADCQYSNRLISLMRGIRVQRRITWIN